MKKYTFYSLIFVLFTCTVFTGCKDERFFTVHHKYLNEAKWVSIWEEYGVTYEQMFVFNEDGTGIELYTKNKHTDFDEFKWKWNGYDLELRFLYPNKTYTWTVKILEPDIFTIIWEYEEITFFPAY